MIQVFIIPSVICWRGFDCWSFFRDLRFLDLHERKEYRRCWSAGPGCMQPGSTIVDVNISLIVVFPCDLCFYRGYGSLGVLGCTCIHPCMERPERMARFFVAGRLADRRHALILLSDSRLQARGESLRCTKTFGAF